MHSKDHTSHRKEVIKNELGLSDLIKHITSIDIKKDGSSRCPFCDKPGKWFTIRNQVGWCYSSSCPSKEANINGGRKGLDIIDIYKWKYNVNFYQALDGLESLIGIDTSLNIQDRYKLRHSRLLDVINIYHSQLWTGPGKSGLEYLRSRGFTDTTIQNACIGYVGYKDSLQSYGIPLTTLIEEGLYNTEYNSEYYRPNRVIFPLKDSWGRLIHLQSRYIGEIPKNDKGEDSFARYKATLSCGLLSISQCLFLKERIQSYKQRINKIIYVTEGIPDALSLVQLELPVVGMIGISNLIDQSSSLTGFTDIVVIGDNDRFGTDHRYYPNQYKSWCKLTPQCIGLQKALGEVRIRCWMPPKSFKGVKVKDANDLLRLGINKEQLLRLIDKHSWDVTNQAINSKGKDLSNHQELLGLISSSNRGKEYLNKYIDKNISPIEYALRVFNA